MKPETTQINDLLRDLVASFVEHPDRVEIEAREHPGACYWTLKARGDDYPKIVGKLGSHLAALTLLVKALGDARDELHHFKLLEPDAARRQEIYPTEKARVYNPEPASELLARILSELAVDQFGIAVRGPEVNDGETLSFVFEICVRDPADYHALVGPRPHEKTSLVGALGTLFRARANKDGVHFTLAVIQAK